MRCVLCEAFFVRLHFFFVVVVLRVFRKFGDGRFVGGVRKFDVGVFESDESVDEIKSTSLQYHSMKNYLQIAPFDVNGFK